MKKIFLLIITVFISSLTFSQNASDATVKQFHDDLLDHFVGNWTASGIVHGLQFNNLHIKADWIMNH